MMKDENEIDRLFQTNIEPFEMTPPKKAWTSLDAELDKKQVTLFKRKAFRYQLISITLSILLLTFITFQYFVPTNYSKNSYSNLLLKKDKNKEIANTLTGQFSVNSPIQNTRETDNVANQIVSFKDEPRLTKKEEAAVIKKENYKQDVLFGQQDIPSKLSSISHEQKNKRIKNNKTSSLNNQQSNNQAVIISNNKEEDKFFANTDPSTSKSSIDEDKIENIVDNGNSIVALDQNIKEGTDLSSKGNIVQNNTNQNLSINALDSNITAPHIINDSVKMESKLISSSLKNIEVDTTIKKENSTKVFQTVANKDSSSITSINFLSKLKSINASKFAISAFFSPDFNYHHLIDNDANEAHQHKGNFKAKDDDALESDDFSYTSGGLLKYDITTNWSIQSGCLFSSSVRRIKPSIIFAEEGSNSEAHYLLNTSLGTAELPNSSTSTPQVGDSLNLKKDSKQILHFINIPLIVRFQYLKNKISYYAYSGLAVNILIKEQSEVTIENPTNETIIISNINGLKKNTFGFLLGIGIQYNFYKGWGIYTEPVFRRSITSINQNTSVTSYPYSIGFNTGLIYHF